MIDTHCHLTYDPLFEKVEQVVQRAGAAGVDRMICVGTTPVDSQKAFALTQRFKQVFSTVGIHPHYADQCSDRDELEQLIHFLGQQPRVVAIGEMGLDQHYPKPPLDVQVQLFQWQLEIAAPLDLPIVIHNRETTDPVLAMLRESKIDPARFVFHCFTGTIEELEKILAFGAKVSFTGITTFKSAPHLAKAAVMVPDDRIMVETDSPFLTPAPHRKVRPNEPRYVTFVADFIAEQRGMTAQAFEALTDRNAEQFFTKLVLV